MLHKGFFYSRCNLEIIGNSYFLNNSLCVSLVCLLQRTNHGPNFSYVLLARCFFGSFAFQKINSPTFCEFLPSLCFHSQMRWEVIVFSVPLARASMASLLGTWYCLAACPRHRGFFHLQPPPPLAFFIWLDFRSPCTLENWKCTYPNWLHARWLIHWFEVWPYCLHQGSW